MKKKVLAVLICLVFTAASMMLTGCGGGVSLAYDDFNLDDYVKVAKYKGLKADPIKVNVTQKQIDEQIKSEVDATAENVNLKEGDTLKAGDTANIDYVGTKDGKAFEGGTDEGFDLTLGSGQFIPGFESGLVGKKVGEKDIKLNLTFPDDYGSEELAGQDVVFTVTVNSATRLDPPEYDDNYIKNHTDYDNKADYEKSVKKSLEKQAKSDAEEDQKAALWDQVIGDTEVLMYPSDIVDKYVEFNNQQVDAVASQYGVDRLEVIKQYGAADEESFKRMNAESSQLRVKQEMTICAIADKEGLDYSQEEIDDMMADYEKNGYTEATIEEQTGMNAQEYLAMQVLYGKVLDFLLDNAKISK